TLETGRLSSADVQTGTGRLTPTTDVTVNPFGPVTLSAPAATIGGNLVFLGGALAASNAMPQIVVNALAGLTVSAAIGEVQPAGGFVPGLREGRLAGAGTYTGANPATSAALYPRMGEVFTTTSPGTPWGSNETWVYTGQFFDADGIVSFGSAIDDGA